MKRVVAIVIGLSIILSSYTIEFAYEKSEGTSTYNKQVTDKEYFIEDSSLGDFILTFDSLIVYNGSFIVGSDEDISFLSDYTYDEIPRKDFADALAGGLSGVGILVRDELVLDHNCDYSLAPYLGLDLKPGVYTIHYKNNVILYVVGATLSEAFIGNELEYKKIVYPLSNKDENVLSENVEKMDKDEFQDMMINNFITDDFYTVGTLEMAGYLGRNTKSYKGYCLVAWLTHTEDYKTTDAVLLNDSTSAFGLEEEASREVLDTFLTEIYDIKENGIYVIRNGEAKIIYVKANSYDIRDYIDFMYRKNELELPVYTFTTGRDIKFEDKSNVDSFNPVYDTYPIGEFYKEPKSNSKSFQGFFYNANYDSKDLFMENGKQTQSDKAKEAAKLINNNKDISTIREIYAYTMDNLNYGRGKKFSRTSEEILTSGIATGCTDYGLAFASIAREKGIPAVFIQTARIDWINDRVQEVDTGITGHILVEVLLNDTWYLVDTTAGKLFLDYDRNNFSLNDGYYVFSKSKEVWDTSIKNEKENALNMRRLFKHFDKDIYENPLYNYIDLTTGEEKEGEEFTWSQGINAEYSLLYNKVNKSGNLEDYNMQRLVYFEADPSKGFNYPYVIILPSGENKKANIDDKHYMLVEPNNFGHSSNNMEDHIYDVLASYKKTLTGSYLGEELWMPILMPIFPRYYLENEKTSLYTHSLDSTTVFIEDIAETLKAPNNPNFPQEEINKLFHLEKQLYNMIEDGKDNLNSYGWNLEEKVFMVGFSASGCFVNNYATIYPEQLKATYSGGVGSNIILPASKYKHRELMFPIGVGEHEYLFGKPFDIKAYNNVAKLVHMGRLDTNEVFAYKAPYDQDEKSLIMELFGSEKFPNRWDGHRKAFYELGGEGLFLTNMNTGHYCDSTDISFITEFFRINKNSKGPNYNVDVSYPNLEVVVGLEDLEK